MTVERTVKVTRWTILALLPGAWLGVCQRTRRSPLHPVAVAALVRDAVLIVSGRY